MDDFGSLGVPNTPGVGNVGERNYKNPQQEHGKKKKKKKEEEKKPILPKPDEVIISGKPQTAAPEKHDEPDDKKSDSDQDNSKSPRPGDNIDITI